MMLNLGEIKRSESCVVTLSGGADSTTMLYLAKSQFKEVIALSFNYGQRHSEELERAKKIAKEVANTKVDVTLDSMNSYERRIVHEALSKDRYVYTESIGEEPNRCVVIKYKETK